MLAKETKIVFNNEIVDSPPRDDNLFPVFLEIWNPLEFRWIKVYDSKNGIEIENELLFFFICHSRSTNYLTSDLSKGPLDGISHLRIYPSNLRFEKIDFCAHIQWLRRLHHLTRDINSEFLLRAEKLMFIEVQLAIQKMKERIEAIN